MAKASIKSIMTGRGHTQTNDNNKNNSSRAWTQVAVAFFLYLNTWGLLSAYGSFQTFYETSSSSSSTFAISTIGSLQSFCLVFLGVLTGPISDGGERPTRYLLLLGSILVVVGSVGQSFCSFGGGGGDGEGEGSNRGLWKFLLAQGLCVGVGGGCIAILGVTLPSLWFNDRVLGPGGGGARRLPVANSVAAMGSGVGGVIYPILIRVLIPKIGFGWTVRVMALVMLVTLGFANLAFRYPSISSPSTTTKESHGSNGQDRGEDGATIPPPPPSQQQPQRPRRPIIHRPSFRDTPYLLFVLTCFLVFLGLYTPFYYIQSFSLSLLQSSPLSATSTTTSINLSSFWLVMSMNLSSIPGRLLPGLIAPRLGPVNLMICSLILIVGTGLGLIGFSSSSSSSSSTVVGLYIMACIYGFLTGSFFALQPTVFVRLSSSSSTVSARRHHGQEDMMKVLGTRIGMGFAVFAVALLFGSPISGALLERYGYGAAWIWTGCTVAAGGLAVACVKWRAGVGMLAVF